MRDFFTDKRHQKYYEKNGYIKVKLLTAETVTKLLEDSKQFVAYKEGFYSLVDDGMTPNAKRQVFELISFYCNEAVESILKDFILLKSTFLNKTESPAGGVPPHQDWTFVDEEQFRSFTMWLPLVPTTIHNGGLHFVPGSHRLHNHLRTVPVSVGPYDDRRYTDMMREHGVLVETEIGEAIIFDSRVIHFSLPNMTKEQRIVAGALFVPAEASTHHYCLNREGREGIYDICKIDREVLLTFSHDELSTKTEVIGQIPIPEKQNIDKELRDLFYPSLFARLKNRIGKWN